MLAPSLKEPKPLSFIRELSLAIEHRWVPERLYVIFTAYFDESGTHGDSHALVVAAQLGTARQWEIFERRLKRLQRENGFTIFHAKEFRAKSGEFRGWSDEKRYRLLAGMTELIRDTLTESISVVLETERYQREFRDAVRPNKMPVESHFGVCFRNVLSRAARTVEAKGDNHRLNVVLEGGHKNAGAAFSIFEEIKTELEVDFGNRLLGTVTIAKKTDSLALMAADFLAYMAFIADRDAKNGARPYPTTPPDKIPPGETPWTSIRLAPHAFDSRVAQFEEGKRRKALKRLLKKGED